MNIIIIKQNIYQTIKLLMKFKWYILFYGLFYCFFVMEYIYPPEKNSPIWGSEAMEGAWNYINQEVYIKSIEDSLIEFFLLFLLATSNMRNHPRIAKLILILPWMGMLGGLLTMIFK